MKLFIIRDEKNKIFALSESAYETKAFFIQNNYYERGYTITKVTDESRANYISIMYYDLFINVFYKEYFIRFIDIKPLMDLISDAEKEMITTIDTLRKLSNNRTIIKNSIIKSMNEVRQYLDKHTKEIVDIDGIIQAYYSTPIILDMYLEYEKRFYTVD